MGWSVPDVSFPGALREQRHLRNALWFSAQWENINAGGNVFVGAHVIIYSSDADADRAFIRDILDFPNVDAGAGWLIFKLPPAEIAVHPTDGAPQHEFYLMCQDINEVLEAVAAKDVQVSHAVTEAPWGLLARIPCQAVPNCPSISHCIRSPTTW